MCNVSGFAVRSCEYDLLLRERWVFSMEYEMSCVALISS